MSAGLMRASTRICAAWPSWETPSTRAEMTRWIRSTAATSRASPARSAAVSWAPERAATIVTEVSLLEPPRIGAASVAAFELGALAGRNWLLLLLTSLPSEGSAREETITTTIHSAITTHR